MQLPRLYLGSMTFGWSSSSSPVPPPVAASLLSSYLSSFPPSPPLPPVLDTARIYAGGATEGIVGAILPTDTSLPPLLGTKAHPSQPGGLSPAGIRAQLSASLAELGRESVHEFYLHQPDPASPLLESLRTLSALVDEGRIEKIGLSNYHAAEVERAFELCGEHGLHKPSV